MHKAIVLTTINKPTEAVKRWSEQEDWHFIVVADRKTPKDWFCMRTLFIPEGAQMTKLGQAIPWNHYSRKMVGYITAIRGGAKVILDTDDDNYLKGEWLWPSFEAKYELLGASSVYSPPHVGNNPIGWVNVYSLFSDEVIWPRGFPLDHILQGRTWSHPNNGINVGVWQGLVDEDPDVDAIYRMTRGRMITFKERPPLALDYYSACPFNSQNTFWSEAMFPLMYLPVTVDNRVTDILRSLVAQPIMWVSGYRLGFTQACAVQKRNAHNLMDDFRAEMPLYAHAEDIISLVAGNVRQHRPIVDNMLSAYTALAYAGFVHRKELTALRAWIKEYKNAIQVRRRDARNQG